VAAPLARVCFIVDGFNLYHSVRNAEDDLSRSLRWLDISGLCASLLSAVRPHTGPNVLGGIHYFSAYADHMESRRPGTVRRHKVYVSALTETGVLPEMAQFKRKDMRCPRCNRSFTRYEEKETDVAIACKLLEITAQSTCDAAVLMTGDTDLVPALKTSRRLAPGTLLGIASPYKRGNNALVHSADFSIKMSSRHYVKHQLPDPLVTAGGVALAKPSNW